MNTSITWSVKQSGDAALVCATLSRVLSAGDVPRDQRLRVLTGLRGRLRRCLEDDDSCRVVLAVPSRDGELPGRNVLRVSVLRERDTDEGDPLWRQAVSCSDPDSALRHAEAAGEPDAAQTLSRAEEDVDFLLERLDEQNRLLSSHREELLQTNQGVLALHAELDAANRAQRRLLAAEQATRAEVEDARRRLSFLIDASAAFSASLRHEDILRRLRDLLVPRHARAAEIRLCEDGELPPSAWQSDATEPSEPATSSPLRIPLTTHRAVLGMLEVTPLGERFGEDDVTMLRELAHRAAVALDNALRYERHRDIAETLQRALLTDLPTIAEVRMAARYLPATSGLNIGGDWFDAFTRPDGSVITVVGDVTGHGLHAAVMMGQLRTALRAYAMARHSPAEMLTQLTIFLRHLQPDLYATAVIARFDPHGPTVTWASAGHLPPLVRTPDGEVQVLDQRSGALLGFAAPNQFREHTLRLAPGSTLLLYTDGLVERRNRGIDLGIKRLGHTLASLAPSLLSGDLDQAAEELLVPMLRDSSGDDDVCLLLCHSARLPVAGTESPPAPPVAADPEETTSLT